MTQEIDHVCEICKRHISSEEAVLSSFEIRKLCKGESPYLWDVWVMDFCDPCRKRKFKEWRDFENYISQRKQGL